MNIDTTCRIQHSTPLQVVVVAVTGIFCSSFAYVFNGAWLLAIAEKNGAVGIHLDALYGIVHRKTIVER